MTTTTTTLVTATQYWHDGPYDGPGFPFFLFPLIWLIVIGGLITAAVLGRRRRDRSAGQRAGERALAEAFAAGDIDDQTYRTRRAVLREKN